MRGAGLRSCWPRWPVALAVVGVVLAGGAAAVAKWPHAWWWLVVVIVIAAAVAPPALTVLSQVGQRRQEQGRAARAGLQGTIGTGGRKLATAAAANLEVRVHRTVLPIPYIHRDEEEIIRAHLRGGRPVLLIGPSMVGKTKIAARIIAEEFGSWPVVIPDSMTALADLDAQDMTLQRSVIWLDDIDRLIGKGGITDGALRRLAAAGNIIVSTIRSGPYNDFRPSDLFRPQEWDVLCVFEHVFIKRSLTQKERERLANAVDNLEVQARIRTVGLGEYVGSAMQVAEALELGAAGADALGYALVLGAADWRRCGMTRPVPSAVLVPLAEPHLDLRGRTRMVDKDAFKAGLAWATREINPNVSLLQPGGTDCYVVYDYALDLIAAQGMPIPNGNWAVIMTNADAPELISLGLTAELAYHLTEIAIHAWRKAADSGHADMAPMAALNLGVLLQAQGNADGAMAAYQQAIDSGRPRQAARAALNLGALLQAQGNTGGAMAAYQQAIDSGQADVIPTAAVNLGVVLQARGDAEGAMAAYQQAIDCGQADQRAKAAFNLGVVLQARGDADGAMAAYQQAIDSGQADQRAKAALNLGVVLQARGDADGAMAAYQQAIDSGQADVIPTATFNLGLLHPQGT
jgi:tetratricopeptide (TPR) repeat protein